MFDSCFYGAYFSSALALITDLGLVQEGRLEVYWLFRHQAEAGAAMGSKRSVDA